MRANLRWLSMLMPLLVLAALQRGPVDAQTGGQSLRVEPALLLAEIAPGESETVSVNIKAEEPLRVEVTPRGLGQRTDGGFEILPAEKDLSAYSGRGYVSVAPTNFTLNGGQDRNVRVSIKVPDDVGEGGRYAIVEVKGIRVGEEGDSNVGIGATIGASVVVTLEGTNQTRTGEITDVEIAPVVAGQPMAVSAALKNTGNYHFGAAPVRMFAAATLKSPAGNNIVASVSPYTEGSLVPTYTRAFNVNVGTSQELAPGRYAVEVQVGLEDGTILDTATEYVDVTAPVALGEEAAPTSSPSDGGDSTLYIAAALVAAALALALLALIAARRRRRASEIEGD